MKPRVHGKNSLQSVFSVRLFAAMKAAHLNEVELGRALGGDEATGLPPVSLTLVISDLRRSLRHLEKLARPSVVRSLKEASRGN